MTILTVETPLSVVQRDSFNPEQGLTLRELYAERFATKPNVPIICIVNRKPFKRNQWDYVPISGDEVIFVQLPQGGNDIIKAVALIALLVVSTAFIGPEAAGLLGLVSGTATFTAVSSAIAATFVAGGALLLNVLMPSSTASTQQTPSPTYSINPTGNTARLLSPIPVQYGQMMIVPDYASTPWTEFSNNDQYLYQLFSLGCGSYEHDEIRFDTTKIWDSGGGLTSSYSNVTLQHYEPGQIIDLFETNVCTSADVGSLDLNALVTVGPFNVNPPGTVIKEIDFDLEAPQGLYSTDSKGNFNTNAITLNLQYQTIDDTGAAIGSVITQQITLSQNSTTPQRWTFKYPVAQGRYRAYATRLGSPEHTDGKQIDALQWVAVKGVIPSGNVFPYHSTLAIKIKATGQLQAANFRSVRVLQKRKIPIWNGTTWSSPTASRSIAWAAVDALKNTDYGASLVDSQIDLAKFLSLDSTWTGRGDFFDGVFDSAQPFWTTLGTILAAGRSQPLLIGGIVSAYRDEPRSLARGVFTPRNIRKGTFNTKHVLFNKDTPDYVIVQFMDNRTWTMNQITCKLPDAVSTEVNAATIQMIGVTDYQHAWREGMYQAACNAYRRAFAGFDTELDGGLLFRGDPIIVGHDAPQWGQSGDVFAWDGTRTLTLSEHVTWSGGSNYIILSQKNGKQFGPVLCTQGTDTNIAVLDATSLSAAQTAASTTLSAIITDGTTTEYTRFLFGASDITTRNAIVAGITSPSPNTFTVSAVLDDSRVYTADTGTPPLPGWGPGIVFAPTTPTIATLTATLASGTDPVNINVSWSTASPSPTGGYILQMSTDGANTWTTVYTGTNTSTSITGVRAGTIYFRVAGIITLQGPWTTTSGSFGTTTGLPSVPTGLAAGASNFGNTISASWIGPSSGPAVTSYTLKIVVGGVTKITKTAITATNYSVLQTDIVGAGGPWTSADVHVASVNGSGVSTDAVVTVTTTLLNAHAVLIGDSSGNIANSIVLGDAQLLVGQTAGNDPLAKTMSGDGTISDTGALTVTKTSGTPFAASATIDTTNASNISSGTLSVTHGGTGASTAGGARINLGVVGLAQYGDANVTLTATDCPNVLLVANLTTPRTWTLPLSTTMQRGDRITIADLGGITSTNTLSVTIQGADHLIGFGIVTANTAVLNVPFASITMETDGGGNWILNAATPLPKPTATTLGGIRSIAAVAHQWIASIDTSGVPQLTQPAFTDVSGTIATGQVSGSYTGITGLGTVTTGTWQATKIGLAYGGTNADLSGTGGAHKVLMQTSAGAAITVAQLAASDLSDGTTGSGSIALAVSPALTGTPTSPTAAAATNTTQIATTAFVTTAVTNGNPQYSAVLGPNKTSTADSNTSETMCGFAFSYTPATSGKCVLMIIGTVQSTLGATIDSTLRYGTGGAPVNGAAVAGTASVSFSVRGSSTDLVPVTFNTVLALTVGTTYWFDAALGARGGGTTSWFNSAFTIFEL